jgi:hypothetical protein
MRRRDLEALLGYLTENAGRYPMDSLRAQMVKAGHAPAEADRAIAVFQGRVPAPAEPVWFLVVGVALFDLALAGLCFGLFSRYGTGQAACSALVLVPAVYLAELFGGLILLGSGKDRWGRGLLLGVLLFFASGLAILLGLLIHWLSRATGS